MPQVPAYAHLSTTEDINYLCNANSKVNFNCKFVWDKKVIVLRNCNTAGDLVDLKISAKYLQFKPWVLLSVRHFDVNGTQTPVPICHLCNDSIESISTKQTLDMLPQHICHHSRVAANIIRDFDCCWHLDGALQLSPDEDADKNRVEIFHIREGSSTTSSQTLVFCSIELLLSIHGNAGID